MSEIFADSVDRLLGAASNDPRVHTQQQLCLKGSLHIILRNAENLSFSQLLGWVSALFYSEPFQWFFSARFSGHLKKYKFLKVRILDKHFRRREMPLNREPRKTIKMVPSLDDS